MPNETQISDSVHAQLRSKRSAIALLPEPKQDAIYSLTFERFVSPRLSKGGLTKEQLEQAKASYIKSLKGQKPDALDFDKRPTSTAAQGAGGTVAGVAAGITGGVAGGVRAGSELLSGSRELTGLGEALVRPLERFSEKGRDVAKEYSTLPKTAEFTGKMIPGLVGAEAALPALETLTGAGGLTTLVEGSQMLPASRAAKAATSGAGFDIGSGDQTSGRNAVGYAAFDLLSRPVGRLLSKAGGKYASLVHDFVSTAFDTRRSVGKREAVSVGKETAEKAESKLVTKLAELFPDKAERVKKGESLESVYSPEDVNKALNATKPKKAVKTPKVEAKVESTTPAQEEKKTEAAARSIVSSNPATQGTVEVLEQLSASGGAKDASGAGGAAPVESAVQRQLREAGLKVKAGEGTSAAAPGQTIKTNDPMQIESAKHEIEKNKAILMDKSVPEDQRKIAADNIKFWSEKHQELTSGLKFARKEADTDFKTFNEQARKMQTEGGSYTERARPQPEAFEYTINWDRYKDKGAEGVDLAKSNARHEVAIQAKEAADTIKSSPTMSGEEKQKALQNIGDRAKHTLYKIKTEKVPEGFVSAKTRDAARKATEYATQTSSKVKETSETLQRSVATHAEEDPMIALIDRSKELESTYHSKGRTTLYNAIVKAWTKQGHGDITKLNEMLSVALEKIGEKK